MSVTVGVSYGRGGCTAYITILIVAQLPGTELEKKMCVLLKWSLNVINAVNINISCSGSLNLFLNELNGVCH